MKDPVRLLTEAVDRLRRLETRMTKFMEFSGFDTQTQRPLFKDGKVTVPSLHVSLKDVLESIPSGYLDEYDVEVYHGDDVITVLTDK